MFLSRRCVLHFQIHRGALSFPTRRHSVAAAEIRAHVKPPRLARALRVGSGSLKLEFQEGGVARFHNIFLRDPCRCPACYHAATAQRLLDTAQLEALPGIRDASVSPSGDALLIQWEAGHESSFSASFLAAHAYWQNEGEAAPTSGAPVDVARIPETRILWGAANFGARSALLDRRPFPRLEHRAWMDDDAALLSGLLLLRDYGVVLIEGVPATEEATEAALRRIAHLRPTMYSTSGMWRTEVRPAGAADNTDTAYTTLALPAHTDGNYFLEPPGLQAFHALVADGGGGGDSLLVDGFAVAEQLRAADAATFALLSSFPIPYAHTEAATVVRAAHPVLNLGDDG